LQYFQNGGGIEATYSARPRESGDPGPQAEMFQRVALDSRFRGNERMECASSRTKHILPPRPQPRQQLRRRPAIGRLTELDLHVAHGLAALEAEHAVDAADIVAATLQDLLQLAVLLEAELRDLTVAAIHRRRAIQPRRVVGGGERIHQRLIPLEVGLE